MSNTEIKYLQNRIEFLEADLEYHKKELQRLEELEKNANVE